MNRASVAADGLLSAATLPSRPDLPALVAFAVVLGGASLTTLVVVRRGLRREVGDVAPGGEFTDWALMGRRSGPAMTWFLLGGSMFTAYTFVAVPALVYGVGALGFFAVPYTIVVFQLAWLVLPWLWRHAAVHGWVTPADVVRARFDSPALALAVAVTGLLATMPYVALQLLGLTSLLAVMGVPPGGQAADLAMAVTFAVLAVGTFRNGLRAPAAVAVLKAVLAFGVTALLTLLALRATGGAGGLFAGAGAALEAGPSGQGSLLLPAGLGSAYVTLLLGSALALLLYPHVLVPTFAARSADALRRAIVWLPLWSLVLGLLAIGGLAALAAGVTAPAGQAELALPGLVRALLGPVPAGAVLGAIGIGALVPAAVMAVAAAATFASNVYLEYVNPTAIPAQVTRVARWVSVLVKLGALGFVLGLQAREAITLQLLGGVWILQTLPAVLGGLALRRPHRYALLTGLVVGVLAGTWLVAAQGFVAVTSLSLFGHPFGVYAGLVALALNVITVGVLTPVLDRAGVARGADSTGTVAGATMRTEWEAQW